MSTCEKQLDVLIRQRDHAATGVVSEVQEQLLAELVELRNALHQDLSTLAVTSSAGNSAAVAHDVEENKQLKEENARLKYRVEILTRGLRTLIDNLELKECQKENEKLKYNVEHLRTVVRSSQ